MPEWSQIPSKYIDYLMHYFILGTLCLSLFTHQIKSAPLPQERLSVERKALLKAAEEIEKALQDLRKLEKAKAIQAGLSIDHLPKPPQTGAMNQLISIPHWEGPLESLLNALAKKYDYQLNIIGSKPALPILVSIEVQNKPLGMVLQNVDYQAGSRAHLSVNDTTPRSIELRYVAPVS